MTIYEFMRECEENGLDENDALNEWEKYNEEKREIFEEEYYSDPYVNAGWAQQDVIDMYRRER